jgi:hypothetical protein
VTAMNYAGGNVIEWSTSTSFAMMACRKKKKKKILLLRVFKKKLSSSSSSRVVTWATHYMITSSKTQRVHNLDANLKTHSDDQNPCIRKTNVCGVASLSADLVLQSNLVCVCVRAPKT